MLTKDEVKGIRGCIYPVTQLRETALELYAKLEEAEAEFKSLDEIHTAGKKDAYARLKKAEAELAACPAKWFAKGQASVKRKNQSGCCCIINDNSDIESVCGAHTEWLEAKLRQLVEGNPEPIEAQIEKLAEEVPAEEWEKLK